MNRHSIVLIIIIAAVVSAYCFILFGGYPGASDACDYGGLARNLVNGKGFVINHVYPLSLVFLPLIPQPDCLWAPGFPIALALAFSIFGISDNVMLGANIFLFLILIIAGYYLALRYTDPKTALVFLVFMGFSQNSYFTILFGSPEILTALFLTLSILFWHNNTNRLIVSAIFFSLAVLTRYQVIILLPVFLVFSGRAYKKLGIFALIVLAVNSVWLLRNLLVFGDPLFSLQRYGEFTKGMGLGDEYYYTYKSLEPAGIFTVLMNYPLLLLRKLIVGVPTFLSKLPLHLNSFGFFLVIWAFVFLRHDNQLGKILKFLVYGLSIYIFVCLFDGHHHRHLYIFDPLLIIAASAGFFDFLISFIILSRFLSAILRPSNIWARSSAFFKSYLVLFITISFRWSTYNEIMSFRLRSLGLLSTSASIITPKVSRICVCL